MNSAAAFITAWRAATLGSRLRADGQSSAGGTIRAHPAAQWPWGKEIRQTVKARLSQWPGVRGIDNARAAAWSQVRGTVLQPGGADFNCW